MVIKMKVYNIAVIGSGDMGKLHVKAWKLAGHQVVSVTDVDTARAQELADQFEVPKVYSDYKESIHVDEIDVVSICLPLVFHAPVTIYAAEMGKHIFCEKPLTHSME